MLCQCLNQSAKYRSSRCLEWVPVDLLRTLLDGCPAVATDQLTQSVYSDPALITAPNTSANGPKINHQASNSQQRMFWILLSSLQKIQLCFYFWNHPFELWKVDQFRIEPWVWKILCFQHCCTSIPLWIFLSLLWRKTSWHNFQNAEAFNKLEISTIFQL